MNITTFNSFKSRNFRLFFMGQSVSLIGTWMQKTAVSWVVYSITQSKFMLGVTVFSTLFPTALVSLFGGIVADRYNRYKILLITQILSLVQAVLLTLAVIFFKEQAVWEIIILSALLGAINGFDVPARQSLVRELVNEERDLPNALALNSSMVNLSKLIGPTIAGFILERFGNEACFALNAFSFIPVISSLLLMKLPGYKPKAKSERNIKREFKESFHYIKQNQVISSVIIFVGIMNLLVLPYSTLTPVFARDIFHGSASTLGIIDGIIGLGAFVGALYLASLKQETDLSRVLARNTIIFGFGLIVFSHLSVFSLALLFLMIGAFRMMAIITVSNTIIQLHVPSELRGRILSIFIMVLTSMMPVGSLLIASVSHYIGVKNTVLIEGIIALIVATFYLRYLKREKLDREGQKILEQQPDDGLVRA